MIKIGDIVINPWVSEQYNGILNPMFATIYLGNNISLDYRGDKHTWGDPIYKDNPKRKTPWKVIGHIDIKGFLETVIKNAVQGNNTITEQIKEEMCDHYCKMSEFYLSQYKDPDEAHEVMVNECCAKCPLERLNK